ncbi:GNAT family N-acetyltransferase [Flavihumibacter stibioxidans]|uniref:N-acetyltransferase domain-containing protein n=1 Tax=Flavihumibacter stibioxidans TaxID=1834163 RepID=A0ABR7M3W9_9BACT|nr:GNAT family N-acetyltransferase [Flavihumibacter stibioxidans]MBC6489720.1 hypothetical protein [Flavihumibacter stibioxidans]
MNQSFDTVRMAIRKYRPEDISLLQQWITDPELMFTVAGPGWNYPITTAQIEAHQQQYPSKQLYIGEADGMPVAMGEIIVNEEHAPRLGRLLVGDQNKRGLGIGEKFIRELMSECIRLYHPDSICLFVLETNLSAIRLYKKIGFSFTGDHIPDMIREGEPRKVLKMILNCGEK